MVFLSPYKCNQLYSKTIAPIEPDVYSICSDGCMMLNDYSPQNLQLLHCLNDKTKANPIIKSTIKQYPLKQLLSRFLAYEINRKKLNYKFTRTPHPHLYKDFYDGEVYQKLKKTDEEEANVIDLIMYVDGFNAKSSRHHSLTMVMFSILNLDPVERYAVYVIDITIEQH